MSKITSNKLAEINVSGILIPVPEILYIKGEGNYSNFIMVDGRKIMSCRTLKFFEKMLDGMGFIRPSKSALINPDAVAHIDFKSQKAIRLIDNQTISISRRNVRPLREKFQAQYSA